MDKEKEIELKIKKEELEEKQKMREATIEKKITIEEERKYEIVKKRVESDSVRQDYIKKQRDELEYKKIEDQIKRSDKQDNVSRIGKQQD